MEEKNYDAMSKEALIAALKENEKKLEECRHSFDLWYKSYNELKAKFDAVKSMLTSIVQLS
ncbi:hypothetical protein [Bacteroides heparinolyticus]|uniref:hypothetical protein n=1 Tax=Prevotella heparinolytica TaxID=28113 RepID=UPI003AF0D91A